MDKRFERSSGIAIITGAVLLVLTMVLHPAGGSTAHIKQISGIIIGSHSLAILAVVVLSFGMVGLAQKLTPNLVLSYAGLVAFAFSGVAAMTAAALNGLAVPFFLERFGEITADSQATVRAVLVYNYSINKAFDLIFILAMSVAAILWSAAIVRTGLLKKWVGVVGLVTGALVVVMMFAGFVFTDLDGLRLFIAGYILWLVLVGQGMLKAAKGAPTE